MRVLTFSLVLMLIAGCNGESDPTSPDGVVAFTTVAKEKTSGIGARRAEVIALQSRWEQVWDEITAGRSPKPPLPSVNFETQLLVLAAYGSNANSCRDVEIERVTRRDGALEISILDKQPPSSCACPAIVVQPVHVVSIPRAATGATYSWRIVTPSCP